MSETEAVDVSAIDTEKPVSETQTVAPESESAPQPPADAAETESKPEKSKGGFQSRIDKLTRDKWDAIQAKQALEAELQALRAQKQPATQPTDAPKESDFTDWTEFQKAVARHEAVKAVEERISAQRQAETQKTQAEQRQSAVREFIVRAENLAAEIPDFSQVAGGVSMDGAVGAALLQSEQGAAVAYFLGANPAEAMRIEAIKDPVRAAIEIGRLEAKATQFVQSRGKSKAPAQAQPLTPGAGAASLSLTEARSMEEYARRYRESRKPR